MARQINYAKKLELYNKKLEVELEKMKLINIRIKSIQDDITRLSEAKKMNDAKEIVLMLEENGMSVENIKDVLGFQKGGNDYAKQSNNNGKTYE